MKKAAVLMASTLMAVGACGTNGTKTEQVALVLPTMSESFDAHPEGFALSYDSEADTVTVTTDDFVATLPREDIFEIEGNAFQGYFTGVEAGVHAELAAFTAETATGSGFARIAAEQGNVGFLGGIFGRDGDTTIPLTGEAIYVGDYLAMIQTTEGTVLGVIYGDVDLTADFEGNTLSGAITNRVNNGGTTFTDLVMNASSISDGSFAGTTSGGEATSPATSASLTGTFSGMLVGPNAEEIVGGTNLEHVIDGTSVYETGAFVGQ